MGYNCLVSTADWRLASHLAEGLEADVLLRTALTGAAARALRWPQALRVLAPSAISCSLALTACLEKGRWRQGLLLQLKDVLSLNLMTPG